MTRQLSMLLIAFAMLTYVGCRQAAETTEVKGDQKQQQTAGSDTALEDATPVVYKVSGMT